MLGTATAGAFLSLCGAATSQTASSGSGSDSSQASNAYLNGQMSTDVVGAQTLNVQSASNGVTAAVTSIGNTVSATGVNAPLDFESTQAVNGTTSALNQVTVGGDSGPSLVANTSATGNSGTAGTCCALVSGNTTQTIAGPGTSAQSDVYQGGYASQVSVSSSAVGNTQGWNTSNGQVSATSTQTNLGGVSAAASSNVGSADEASYAATSVGNDVEVNATNSPVSPLTVTQDQEGSMSALVDTTQGSGGDSVSTASSVANNANVYADSYGDSVTATQTNNAAVTATSSATLGSWTGSGVSSAYGVGNSNVVANAGSSTGLTNTQSNGGAITVAASLFGTGSGGDGYVSAAGVGNASSAYACATCNGTIRANNKQTNSGAVHVTGTLTAGRDELRDRCDQRGRQHRQLRRLCWHRLRTSVRPAEQRAAACGRTTPRPCGSALPARRRRQAWRRSRGPPVWTPSGGRSSRRRPTVPAPGPR